MKQTVWTSLRRAALSLFALSLAIPQPAWAQQAGAPDAAPEAQPGAAMPDSAATENGSADALPEQLSAGYVLGPGDIIEVSLVGQSDYLARVQVQTDGTVQLPYLRTIPAANMTVTEFQNDVAQRLREGGYYNDPAVAVMVASYASRYAILLGELSQPGLMPIDRDYRLSEIVARAGGVTSSGVDTITLTRESGEQIKVNVADMATGGPESDPMVRPGDRIFVARMEEGDRNLFYIYGQVSAPGSYPLARGMTVRMALARGGGLTALGSEGKVKVFREGVEMDDVDLSYVIEQGDVIRVGERFF